MYKYYKFNSNLLSYVFNWGIKVDIGEIPNYSWGISPFPGSYEYTFFSFLVMPGTKVDHNEMEKRGDDSGKEGEKKTPAVAVVENNNNNKDHVSEIELLYRKKRETEENDWVARLLKPYVESLLDFIFTRR